MRLIPSVVVSSGPCRLSPNPSQPLPPLSRSHDAVSATWIRCRLWPRWLRARHGPRQADHTGWADPSTTPSPIWPYTAPVSPPPPGLGSGNGARLCQNPFSGQSPHRNETRCRPGGGLVVGPGDEDMARSSGTGEWSKSPRSRARRAATVGRWRVTRSLPGRRCRRFRQHQPRSCATATGGGNSHEHKDRQCPRRRGPPRWPLHPLTCARDRPATLGGPGSSLAPLADLATAQCEPPLTHGP